MTAGITINRAMSAREWMLLLALAVLWGSAYPFAAFAVREIPPLTLSLLRVGGAAIALHIVMRVMGVALPRTLEGWAMLTVQGFLNNIFPFTLINWGQQYVPSGVASVLIAATPFFTVIAAHYLTQDERITPSRMLGVIAGIAGVATMIGAAALGAFGIDALGELAMIGAALSYAAAGIFGRRAGARGIAPLAISTGMLTMSTLIMLPVAMIVDRPWTLPMPSLPAWLAVAAIALPSTALGYLIFFRVLASAGATNIMLVTFLQPIVAIVLGIALLGERLEPRHFAGIALIAFGLAAIDGRLWRWFKTTMTRDK